jgi:hypothetical protein
MVINTNHGYKRKVKDMRSYNYFVFELFILRKPKITNLVSVS